MEIKETINTITDKKGRIIKRTRKIIIDDSRTNRGYDYATRHRFTDPSILSWKRIIDAYEDYCTCRDW